MHKRVIQSAVAVSLLLMLFVVSLIVPQWNWLSALFGIIVGILATLVFFAFKIVDEIVEKPIPPRKELPFPPGRNGNSPGGFHPNYPRKPRPRSDNGGGDKKPVSPTNPKPNSDDSGATFAEAFEPEASEEALVDADADALERFP